MIPNQYYNLAITPLSPVHLGSGSDYEPTAYVIDGEALFEFDGAAAMSVLSDGLRRELDRILNGKATPEMLRAVQAYFYRNRDRLIAVSRRQVRVNPSVEAFYADRVGKVVQQEGDGSRVQNRLEIERTAWNPASDSPYLPGSGLKGAIRTALLDAVNDGRSLAPKLKNDRQANRRLQQELFRGKFHTDPMRLVSLGDASPAEGVRSGTQVFFALNRKKQPVQKGGTLVQSQAEQHGLYQLLECLPPLRPRSFVGTLAIQQLGQIEKPGKTPSIRFSVDDIANACNAFYRPILGRELDMLRKQAFLDQVWGESLEAILESFADDLNGGRAFLLRVGRHSGAESVTLNGLPRQIRIMGGASFWDEARGRLVKKDSSEEQARTIWLAGHERQTQRGMLPFGWILVEICPEDEAFPAWPGDWASDDQQDWLESVHRRISIARSKVEKELEQERERAAKEREVEEAARRAQEEKENAIAKAKATLPGDAAWVEARRLSGDWSSQERFLSEVERYVKGVDSLSAEAYERLAHEVDARWRGILIEPDAVKGKKKKPKYNPRPRELAKRLLGLRR